MQVNDTFSINFKKYVVDEPRTEHAQQMAYGMIDALYSASVRDGESYEGHAPVIENLLECARKDVQKGDMDGAWSTVMYIGRVLENYGTYSFNQKALRGLAIPAPPGRGEVFS
ncbi:MAG TPA: hypothetical protein VJ485_00640 [archaeon]|nr:hypothetical protein [archaeon]